MFHHVTREIDLPKLKQINEEGTRYYVTPEGNKYPSVTTVLSEYSRKGILEWRNKVGHENANRIASKASTRGTKLHKACEDYLNNKEPIFKTPFEKDLFSQIKPILDTKINNIHAQELRMYSDHLRMAGTVDCIAEFDGKLAVIDFKTASKRKESSYIENYFMQCSAYAIMYEERFNIPINKTVVIIAVEDDEPQVFFETRDNHVKRLLEFRDIYESKN
jgi:genome maintenance exonuclease 1